MQKKPFTELGLSPEVLKAIARIGYEEASPIQSEAIPLLMGGADVVGQSQTGSGKTAAFAIPAVERVDGSRREPQALILCPTRELAAQVAEEVAKLAFFKRGVRELPIYGGAPYERQLRGLEAGAQIIIGTPGRVIDHLERGTLKVGAVGMIVLDEADRMLDMGFIDEIRRILEAMPPQRQTVLFSATLPRPIQELIKSFTREPVFARIEARALEVPAIEQVYYEVERRSKLEVLCRLIDVEGIKFGIIFCATKMMVDELTENLCARGYAADKLHGDMSQAMRERVMAKFRKHGIEFLVATDVAARGVDVENIEAVFNYDLPQDAEDYVHRIGRTGRAGRSGRAITLVSGREIWKLQGIMRFAKSRIRRERVPSAEEVEEKRANAFFETLRGTLEQGDYARQDEWIDRLLGQGYSPTEIASALIHLATGERPLASAAATERPSKPQPPLEAPPQENERPEAAQPGKEKRPKIKLAREEFPQKARPPRDERRPAKPTEHEAGMRRLVLNLGREQNLAPGDVVGVLAGLAKINRESIGAIRLTARETFVDVAEKDAARALKKLNGIRFKGHKLAIFPTLR